MSLPTSRVAACKAKASRVWSVIEPAAKLVAFLTWTTYLIFDLAVNPSRTTVAINVTAIVIWLALVVAMCVADHGCRFACSSCCFGSPQDYEYDGDMQDEELFAVWVSSPLSEGSNREEPAAPAPEDVPEPENRAATAA